MADRKIPEDCGTEDQSPCVDGCQNGLTSVIVSESDGVLHRSDYLSCVCIFTEKRRCRHGMRCRGLVLEDVFSYICLLYTSPSPRD